MAKSLLSYLSIDYSALISSGLLLTEPPKPFFEYKDGIRGEQIGIKYIGVSPDLDYKQLDIKIPDQLKPSVEYQGNPITVYFTGVTGTLYQDFKRGGEVKISLYAKAVSTNKGTIKLLSKEE